MSIGIAMIMTTSDEDIRTDAMRQQLAEGWPDLHAATAGEEGDGVAMLRVGEEDVILGKMPAPIPWADLEGPCETSILWKNAAAEVKRHKFHWIVTVNGELSPLEMSTRLTQATAAALAACPSAIGVYWGNATLLIPKEMFIDFAKEVLPEGPPLPIWVDFRIGRTSEKTSAGFTSGMKALGHMEFETEDSPEPPSELYDRLMALAGYVVENGPIIKDGDTVGEDAQERIRVVYSPSSFGHEDKVMRLVYESESPKKPWWKLW